MKKKERKIQEMENNTGHGEVYEGPENVAGEGGVVEIENMEMRKMKEMNRSMPKWTVLFRLQQ